jgi:hypothetical protein
MPRTKTVTLGGQEYLIQQLNMRANKEWRDSLGVPVMQLVDFMRGMGDLELKTDDLLKIGNVVKELLLGSMDTLLDALFAYSPALMADRERIEVEAYDDEAIAALGACVALAYPLDRVLMGLTVGSPATAISMNSRSANGASGTKKHSAERQRATSKT